MNNLTPQQAISLRKATGKKFGKEFRPTQVTAHFCYMGYIKKDIGIMQFFSSLIGDDLPKDIADEIAEAMTRKDGIAIFHGEEYVHINIVRGLARNLWKTRVSYSKFEWFEVVEMRIQEVNAKSMEQLDNPNHPVNKKNKKRVEAK